jgi:hypothetical protein
MPFFETPVRDGNSRVGPPGHPLNPLMRFLGSWAQGVTVWKDSLGVWHESTIPYLGGATTTVHDWDASTYGAPDEGLATAQKVYSGGYTHTITQAEADELTAAGYEFQWWQLTDWTHSWDAQDSEVANGRVWRITDRSGQRPLIKMAGSLPMLGASTTRYGPLPGPLYIPASARFGNRPAVFCDSFPVVGSIFPLYAGLSPNGDSNSSTDESRNWFNAPTGYPQPYWVAVLARLSSGPNSAIWDAQNGGPGTGPTIGQDIFGGVDDRWEVSLFGPNGGTEKIEVNHVSSVDETVLVFVYVNGASSFMEVNWRDSGGVLQTMRQAGTLGPHRYLECFLGWVHDTYWSKTAVKVGPYTEAEMDAIRAWAGPFMPAAASLPAEP